MLPPIACLIGFLVWGIIWWHIAPYIDMALDKVLHLLAYAIKSFLITK